MIRPKKWASNAALIAQALSLLLITGHLMWWAEHLERCPNFFWISLLALIFFGSGQLIWPGYYEEGDEDE